MNHQTSERLFAEAKAHTPGGVNSPVRAFKSVGCDPVFYAEAQGAEVTDADGNRYLDFIGSWGPLILGHRPVCVMEALRAQMDRGLTYGAPCESEMKLAEKICQLVPSVEKVRMVSSGTEATMSALRLARGYTGREKIIKFQGCYHGHSDSLLVSAGSGVATFGIPGTAGVTKGAVADTLVAPYNDLDAVRAVLEANRGEVACIIVEPAAGNMGVVASAPGFLEGLRLLCDEFGALLIFDEVITGFRVALGGAQEYFGVTPDLTCFGKIIGGGLPVGAFAGPAEIMDSLAPEGPVYQAGTLSGNPLTMEAGLAVLSELETNPPYARLDQLGARLEQGLNDIIADTGMAACVNRLGSLATLFFTEGPVTCWDEADRSDTAMFSRYFQGMLDGGFLIAPSQFEALFLSAAHTEAHIDRFLETARAVLEAARS